MEAAAPAEITSRCLSRHFLISIISLVYTRGELIAQVKQWKKVSLLLPAKLQPGVPAPVSAQQHPAEGWILEEVLRNGTKPALHRPAALHQARTPLRWQGPSSVLPGGSPEAGQGPVWWLQIKAQELAGRSRAATQHPGGSAWGCHPRHGPVPNPHTVPKEGMSPGHLWASWVPCREPKMHPTGTETQGQAQGWPRPWPRLSPTPSQAPQHKQHPCSAELTEGQGGEAGTMGTAPAHPQGHEGVRNIPDSVGHHGSETKCPGPQAARPLSVPHFRSLRLRNFVNNLCVAYGEKEGRVPLKTRSLSLPASRKGRQWEQGQPLAGERSATSPQPLTLRRCPRHHRIFSRTSPPPTSRIPFLNEVWGRYEAVPPRPAPPQRVDPG